MRSSRGASVQGLRSRLCWALSDLRSAVCRGFSTGVWFAGHAEETSMSLALGIHASDGPANQTPALKRHASWRSHPFRGPTRDRTEDTCSIETPVVHRLVRRNGSLASADGPTPDVVVCAVGSSTTLVIECVRAAGFGGQDRPRHGCRGRAAGMPLLRVLPTEPRCPDTHNRGDVPITEPRCPYTHNHGDALTSEPRCSDAPDPGDVPTPDP